MSINSKVHRIYRRCSMNRTYFLGANSKNGFYSLYDELFAGEYRLHIIKGGPGTGKSSFMRKIGALRFPLFTKQ